MDGGSCIPAMPTRRPNSGILDEMRAQKQTTKVTSQRRPGGWIARMLEMDIFLGTSPSKEADDMRAGTASPFGGQREGPLPPHLMDPSPRGPVIGYITLGKDDKPVILRAVDEKP
jgi:hypothetical protein